MTQVPTQVPVKNKLKQAQKYFDMASLALPKAVSLHVGAKVRKCEFGTACKIKPFQNFLVSSHVQLVYCVPAIQLRGAGP